MPRKGMYRNRTCRCYRFLRDRRVLGLRDFHDSFERGRTTGSLLNLPVWIAEASVPLGFALLTLQALVELIGLRGSDTTSLGATHE